MVRRLTVCQVIALGLLSTPVVADFQCDAVSTNCVTFPVCQFSVSSPSQTAPSTADPAPLTVTVSRKARPTTPLELLEEALEKQGLLVHKKNDFLSMGPQQKDNVVTPTAPSDADMKVADPHMYAPLLAHYPTRGFFLRLTKLLAYGLWMNPGCVNRMWVVSRGELHVIHELQQSMAELQQGQSRARESGEKHSGNPGKRHFQNLIVRYRSAGDCEFFPDRIGRLAKHAWKLFEFEYEGQKPDAVCVYVERHAGWVEQVVVGWSMEETRRLNCTSRGE